MKGREQTRNAVKCKTASFSVYPTFRMRFYFIQTGEGKLFPGKGISMNNLSPQINFSPMYIFSVSHISILSVTLPGTLRALCGTCFTNFTASNNHPPPFIITVSPKVSLLLPFTGSTTNSPQISLPIHLPQHARTSFLKHSYKHVFLLVTNAVNSHCPPH